MYSNFAVAIRHNGKVKVCPAYERQRNSVVYLSLCCNSLLAKVLISRGLVVDSSIQQSAKTDFCKRANQQLPSLTSPTNTIVIVVTTATSRGANNSHAFS